MRSGDARESLGGPFIYVMVLLFSTLLFWWDSPVGVVSLATMACKDSLADLVGRRLGSTNKWFFNWSKPKVERGVRCRILRRIVWSYLLADEYRRDGRIGTELGRRGGI